MSDNLSQVEDHDKEPDDDGAVDTPLHRLPGFGTGLHRRRVAFVKAGESPASKSAPAGSLSGGAVSDLYLSIVMGQAKESNVTPKAHSTDAASVDKPATCHVCRLPLTTSATAAAHHHETCLVHQVSLDHSKPPSALDRSRFGLAIMSAHGWDPDSGRGLGANQQGIPYPVEARLRPERQALGSAPSSSRDGQSLRTRPSKVAASEPVPARRRNHTRKQLRAMEEDRRRRHDRLREQIMGSRDLDKYLRP
ncbi:hypothetical protein SEPCBS119000_003441 [Sporothrix epigloea]|uniref:G-patch domain-containing protein n=1 Tax=Sporothrix epigloea TaxID=1892477 RepID=A0ABP0DLM1_9PEZI